MKYMTTFVEVLRDLMDERNITANRLAKETGISQSKICKWLNLIYCISLRDLLTLADYFNCSIEFLLGRTETPLDYIPRECPPFYVALKRALAAYKISGYALMRGTKKHDSIFTHWKNGANPKLDTLVVLADFIGCTIDFLVGREG